MTLQQTGTGYRDPAKAMTIKALQERAKAAADAAAKATIVPEGPVTSPWQGAAHLSGILSGQMQEGRADAASADARARLAQVMSGIDPEKGASMQQIAEMQQLDPEFANQEYARMMTERANVRNREDEQAAAAELQSGQQTFTHGENEASRTATSAENELNRQADLAKQKLADATAAGRQDDQQLATEELARINAQLDTEEQKRKEGATVVETQRQEALPQVEQTKIIDAFNKGQFGDPASPEAIAQKDAALAKANATTGQSISSQMSPGQIAVDTEFGKNIRDVRSAGATGAVKAAKQVNLAIQKLEGGDITGFRQGLIDKTLPSWASSLLNPDGTTIAKSNIRETVAQTLRQTLGAQFTQQEGENLMERAFDPSLDEAENIRRARLLLDQVTETAAVNQSMLDYWDTHNASLVGYTGPTNATNVMDTLRGLAEGGAGVDMSAPADGTAAPPADGTATGGAPEFDPAQDQEGDTGSDESGNWIVRGGRWVRQ